MKPLRLSIASTAFLLLGLFVSSGEAQEQSTKKKLLLITESKGFRHDCVKRGKNGELCLVEKTFTELSEKSGLFDVVCSQDSRKEITAENLRNFDAAWFYTTGELPLSEVQKSDFLAFVRGGKGFGGSHSATDTFYGWKEFGEMIGGYFDLHPWHAKVPVVVEDAAHPATRHFPASFIWHDEIYQFKAPYSRDKLRVLMRLEPKWAAEQREKEMERIARDNAADLKKVEELEAAGKQDEAKKLRARIKNRQPQIHRTDADFALAWIRDYGKGRVFYTALGHRDEVWRNPDFHQHVIGALRYLFRLSDADATPRGAK